MNVRYSGHGGLNLGPISEAPALGERAILDADEFPTNDHPRAKEKRALAKAIYAPSPGYGRPPSFRKEWEGSSEDSVGALRFCTRHGRDRMVLEGLCRRSHVYRDRHRGRRLDPNNNPQQDY